MDGEVELGCDYDRGALLLVAQRSHNGVAVRMPSASARWSGRGRAATEWWCSAVPRRNAGGVAVSTREQEEREGSEGCGGGLGKQGNGAASAALYRRAS